MIGAIISNQASLFNAETENDPNFTNSFQPADISCIFHISSEILAYIPNQDWRVFL